MIRSVWYGGILRLGLDPDQSYVFYSWILLLCPAKTRPDQTQIEFVRRTNNIRIKIWSVKLLYFISKHTILCSALSEGILLALTLALSGSANPPLLCCSYSFYKVSIIQHQVETNRANILQIWHEIERLPRSIEQQWAWENIKLLGNTK